MSAAKLPRSARHVKGGTPTLSAASAAHRSSARHRRPFARRPGLKAMAAVPGRPGPHLATGAKT